MLRWLALLVVAGNVAPIPAQTAPRPKFDAFEVATVKPINGDEKGRYIKLEGNRFVAVAYPVRLMIAAAYDLNPKTILGGPAWLNDDKWNVEARTPGTVKPTHDEQMRMLRALLVERFGLKFHREAKEFSIFAITVAKGGAKMKATTHADDAPLIGPGVAYPDHITLPALNATVGDLASLLQRAIVDRPMVDRTGLSGRYDFELTWAPDSTQFQGDGPKADDAAAAPPLFPAMERQLGLKVEATKGDVQALVVDGVVRPTGN